MQKASFPILFVVLYGVLLSFAAVVDRTAKYKEVCPKPNTTIGDCTVGKDNCLYDSDCANISENVKKHKTKCCREGCNKICKVPVSLEKMIMPSLSSYYKDAMTSPQVQDWKDQKQTEWNAWAEDTRKLVAYVHLIQSCTKFISTIECGRLIQNLLNSEIAKRRNAATAVFLPSTTLPNPPTNSTNSTTSALNASQYLIKSICGLMGDCRTKELRTEIIHQINATIYPIINAALPDYNFDSTKI